MHNSFWRRYREILWVALLLLLPILFYISNARAPYQQTKLDRFVTTLSMPVQRLVTYALSSSWQAWHHYVDLRHVQADNDALRARIERLDAQIAYLQEVNQENGRLRMLMALKARAPAVKTLLAEVIAQSPSSLFLSLRINRGVRDGVTLGAAVIAQAGVVGRVAAVGDTFADVMLLIDTNSSVDVIVQRTRARARVRGQGTAGAFGLDVQHLSRLADVEPGDLLITGGLGANFPKGLAVGRVSRIERKSFGLYQRADVEPTADVGRLEAVLVVMPDFSTSADFEQAP